MKQPRGTQRYRPTRRDDEDTLTQAIVTLGQPIWPLWLSSDHGVAQAGRLEGRQGPGGANLASRGAEGSTEAEADEDGCGSTMGRACGCSPQHANHVWSYDFVSAKTHDGRTVRMLNLIDEHTGRACWFARNVAGAAPR